MKNFLIILVVLFAIFICTACKDDCNCDDEESGAEIWEEDVHVTVTGPDVADRKVYVKTCEGQQQGSGPKDPVDPEASSYNYTFALDVNVQIDEDDAVSSGAATCYQVYGQPDPNCDIENPEKIWLEWGDYVAVEVVYTCD